MDEAAVPIGGEAFAALTVVFVLGMLLIVLARIVGKMRKRRRTGHGEGSERRG